MSSVWLVALPNKEGKFNELKNAISGEQSAAYQFGTPSLTIGTLDSLMALTDDLVKINVQVEVQIYLFYININ